MQAILSFWSVQEPSEFPGLSCLSAYQVEDMIFQVPMRRLKQSQYFRDMLEDAHTGLGSEGKDNEHPISLSGISAFEMTSFLDVLEASYVDYIMQRVPV